MSRVFYSSSVHDQAEVATLVRAGLVPVFIDSEPDTYCIDVDAIEAMPRVAR